MVELTLPFWLSGVELEKLRAAAQAFFEEIAGWARQPGDWLDADQAPEALLDLYAWEQGLRQIPGESRAQFRTRVAKAVEILSRAGSRAGLEQILPIYGLSNFHIDERPAHEDWGTIEVLFDLGQLLDSGPLTDLLTEWARLCRRYLFTGMIATQNAVGSGSLSFAGVYAIAA